MFYSPNQLLSYNADISCVLDLRGCGKTTGVLKYCFDLATRCEKLKFAWFRMTHNEYKLIKGSFGSSIPRLFPKVMRGWNYRIKNDYIQFFRDTKKGRQVFNGGRIGYIDQFRGLKGAEMQDADVLVIDELLPEGGTLSKDDYDKVMSLIDTIFRLRKPRVIFMSNCVTMANPFFVEWGITKLEQGFTRVKGRNIVIEYGSASDDFIKARRESAIGKLTEGTKYGEYATDNRFLLDDDTDVLPKPKGNEHIFLNVIANGMTIQVSMINSMLYFCNGKDKTLKSISPYLDDAKHGRAIFVDKNYPFMKSMLKYFLKGKVVFSNQAVKNEIVLILRKVKCGF